MNNEHMNLYNDTMCQILWHALPNLSLPKNPLEEVPLLPLGVRFRDHYLVLRSRRWQIELNFGPQQCGPMLICFPGSAAASFALKHPPRIVQEKMAEIHSVLLAPLLEKNSLA